MNADASIVTWLWICLQPLLDRLMDEARYSRVPLQLVGTADGAVAKSVRSAWRGLIRGECRGVPTAALLSPVVYRTGGELVALVPGSMNRMNLGVRRLKEGQSLFWRGRSRDGILTEPDLIKLLVTDMPLMGQFLLSVFCTYFQKREPGDGVYLSIQIPTTALGLPRDTKPGDIDLLIIPHKQGVPQPSEAIAIESKVCRPTQSNPGKSPNSFGLAQSNGLISIGFPWVALLHFIQSEPSPRDQYVDGEIIRVIDVHGRAERLGTTKFDWFAYASVDRHLSRLQHQPIHPAVGLAVFEPFVTRSVEIHAGHEVDIHAIKGHTMFSSREAHRGEGVSRHLCDAVVRLLIRYPEKFFDLPWFPPEHS
jgi:hypothetical protein